MQSMATRIRRARLAAKLSQQQLAIQVGVKRSAVAQWEQPAGTSPSIVHLATIAITTGMSFEWLATGRGQSRRESEEFAAMTEDFAHSELESKVLDLLRRLSPRRQKMAFELLEVLLR